MWGRFYWAKKEEKRKTDGIVVLFAWLSSQEKHLRPHADLYWCLGWSCLICHVNFFTLFLPEKASMLAQGILNELAKEVKVRPLPIVLTTFSGGSKGCLYKVLQLVKDKCDEQQSLRDDYQLVGECLSGQIFDSSPVDFTSDVGARFVLQPAVLRLSHPPRIVSWMAKAFASGLQALFLKRFEAQRADYWQTLYSSVSMGPFLIFCSEDDGIAPYKNICGFAQHLQELGGDVKLIKWSGSSHVAHYKFHKSEYTAAVTEFLGKASLNYYSRTRQRFHPCSLVDVLNSESASSCENIKREVTTRPSCSLLFGKAVGAAASLAEEQKKELFYQLPNVWPAHGVLDSSLFDVCSPKNIEGWDLIPSARSIKRSRL